MEALIARCTILFPQRGSVHLSFLISEELNGQPHVLSHSSIAFLLLRTPFPPKPCHVEIICKSHVSGSFLCHSLNLPLPVCDPSGPLLLPKATSFLSAYPECCAVPLCSYEAWILYNFLSLCLAYLGGPGAVVVKSEGKMIEPSWWYCTCCLPVMPVNGKFIRRCKQGVLQFVWLKPILAVLILVLDANDKYEEGSWSSDTG